MEHVQQDQKVEQHIFGEPGLRLGRRERLCTMARAGADHVYHRRFVGQWTARVCLECGRSTVLKGIA